PTFYSGTLLPTAAVNAGGHAAVAWSAGAPDTFHTLLARYEVARPAGPGGGPGAGADTTRPVIGKLRLNPRRFAVAGRRAAGKRRVKRGSTLRFRLSERATVRIRIDRLQRGRRAGGRCRPAAKTGRRCLRLRRAGTLVRRDRRAGANRIRISGRIGRRALRPGRYRATVVAIDSAGNRSKPRRVAFRIVRAR
ncbi:MAG: hypothetical protein GXY03_05620, partial [Solirubrobacterales bacterium]|nr:hypothetical protein [Solirubrobacterales bacterium]